jgi:hypothetical protein
MMDGNSPGKKCKNNSQKVYFFCFVFSMYTLFFVDVGIKMKQFVGAKKHRRGSAKRRSLEFAGPKKLSKKVRKGATAAVPVPDQKMLMERERYSR